MPISENIKILRERFGITQKDLAAIAGVTDKAVSTWELGTNEPRMGAIQKIADYFGLQKSNIIEDGGMDINPGGANANPSEIDEIFNALTPDNRAKLIELARLYLTDQRRKQEKK